MALDIVSGNRLEQVSPYENQPLQPGHIRLLSLEWVTEPALRFSMYITVELFGAQDFCSDA